MDIVSEAAADRGQDRHRIEVADAGLNFRSVSIADFTPTGAQLAAAAGFKPAQQATVLQVLANGELEDIRPDETADLRHAEGRFVIVESDRSYRLTIDGERFDWPCRVVSGGVLRKLGQVPSDKAIFLEESETADRAIGPHDLVNLDAAGVESFVTRVRHWKLNVQGVGLEVETPTIGVRDAIARAGFNPDQGWQIFLKIAGQPKRPVTLTDTIDLRTPGIEKLRLTPNEVNNGEAPWAPRREFDLLEADDAHLARLGLRWETVVQLERRWLLLHHYPLPRGFSTIHALLALEIPLTYPGAQIYGFYAYPPLALTSGRAIDNTQMRGTIDDVEFHGWSRNRGSLAWNPQADNVATQLMLVEAALAKEVGE
ncbi:MAG: multiubiquitin domain-containing protein [Tagaea sp.]|nr:multiubiquitin domain-containing protein [Tagaea sp.]